MSSTPWAARSRTPPSPRWSSTARPSWRSCASKRRTSSRTAWRVATQNLPAQPPAACCSSSRPLRCRQDHPGPPPGRRIRPALLGFLHDAQPARRRGGGQGLLLRQQRALRRDDRGAGQFAEWAVVHGNRYGTSIATVEQSLAEGVDCLFDVDFQGGREIRKQWPDDSVLLLHPAAVDGGAGTTAAPAGDRRARGHRAPSCHGVQGTRALRRVRLPGGERQSSPGLPGAALDLRRGPQRAAAARPRGAGPAGRGGLPAGAQTRDGDHRRHLRIGSPAQPQREPRPDSALPRLRGREPPGAAPALRRSVPGSSRWASPRSSPT